MKSRIAWGISFAARHNLRLEDFSNKVAKTCNGLYNVTKPAFKEPYLDDQTILATSEDFGTVSVCPGGVVHVNLAHCSLKFLPSDFLKFSELMAEAQRNFDPPRRLTGRPLLQVVSSETRGDTPPDEDK